MEIKKEIFNEIDALKLIEQTISTTKQKFNDNGVLLILWGWIVIVGNVINYLGQTLNIAELFWYWPIVCTAGGIFSGIYGSQREKKKGAKSHIDNLMKYVWRASGISAVLLWAAAAYVGWEYINPAMFVAFGVPVLITGGVLQFKSVIVGGLILFFFGIITFLLVKSEFQPLIAALGFLLGYVIPGYMLNKNKV